MDDDSKVDVANFMVLLAHALSRDLSHLFQYVASPKEARNGMKGLLKRFKESCKCCKCSDVASRVYIMGLRNQRDTVTGSALTAPCLHVIKVGHNDTIWRPELAMAAMAVCAMSN